MVTGEEEPALPVAEILSRLERGDAAVEGATRRAGEQLGLLVHNLLVVVDPAVVVLGGPMSRIGPFVAAALEAVTRFSGETPYHRAVVRVSRFGPSAVAVGAAGSVLHRLLHPLVQRPAARAR